MSSEGEAAEAGEPSTSTSRKPSRGMWATIKKRWRGWLRAVHRDFGYVAVGFTVIYALSGLAINHIKDWDPSFTSTEITKTIPPIGDSETDEQAVARVTEAVGAARPDDVYRAGDELRLGYAGGAQVTVVGDQVTYQDRSPRFFLRVANWLHYNRGKKAWTYVADVYAVMLLYLAISGIFMIKGRLGLRWRGAVLVSLGVAVPLGYVVLSGGPAARSGDKPTSASTPDDNSKGGSGDPFARPSDRRTMGGSATAPASSGSDAPHPEQPPASDEAPAPQHAAPPVPTDSSTTPARALETAPTARTDADPHAADEDDDAVPRLKLRDDIPGLAHSRESSSRDGRTRTRTATTRTATTDGLENPYADAARTASRPKPPRESRAARRPGVIDGLKDPFADDDPPRPVTPLRDNSRLPGGHSSATTANGSPYDTALERP